MNVVSRFLLCLIVLGTSVLAQTAVKPAAIEGIVTRDPDGQPVKKALIELIAEHQSEAGDYTAVTGPDGTFRIENIIPGRYHLFTERTGLLDTDKQRGRTEGRILSLTAGQEVKDIHLRLLAAAVIRGHVTDEDGDPLANVDVSAMRQTFVAGHSHWEQAGAERSNDLGEYRIANLPEGNIYLSVSPPPDFKTLIESSGVAARDGNAPEKPAPATYQTTYYPGTTDRSQATPITLHSGDDFPADFSLVPHPSVTVRGSVVNLPARATASIMLQSRDFSLMMNGAEMHKDGSFVIRDVSPGSYTILASVEGSAVPMTARQTLQVGSSNVEGLRLSPQPGAAVHGHLRFEGKNPLRVKPHRIFLTLQMVDAAEENETSPVFRENFSNITHVAADGSFQWTDVPPGNYYVQIVGDGVVNADWFIKSVLGGGRDVSDSGISVNGGEVLLDLVASANGGVAEGVVVNDKGDPVPNAIVVAVPEMRMRGRIDRYGKTVSDQTGRFSLRALRPGDYTLFAWENVEGEEYFNPEFLKSYEGQGSSLHVSEGERKSLQLQVIAGLQDSAASD